MHNMRMNILAKELNEVLESGIVGRLLSDLGNRMYFPKGIIAQSAEAKQLGKKANGTIGMAVKNGKPLILPSIQKELPNLTSGEAVAYAPTAGFPTVQEAWKKLIIQKNPLLAEKRMSNPVVVPGLTAGISYLCDLFLSEGDTLLTANPAWDNYALILETRRNAKLEQFTLFTETGFNTDSFEKAIREQSKKGAVRVLLNFPQNPSGYTPTVSEMKDIIRILTEVADGGTDIMVWCDDAYFGLNFEEDAEKQSLFAYLADAHEKILAVKIDGPTKEDYVWGFRSGFLTFSAKGMSDAQYEALNKKLMGTVRSSVSCASTPSQSILLKALENKTLAEEKEAFRAILESRYRKVKAFVQSKAGHKVLTPLPFNSGYFMSLHCKGVPAETLRRRLLDVYGIGVIAIDAEHIRVAFSSVEEELLDEVYTTIYKAAEELV